MFPALKDAIDQEISFFSEIKTRLDLLAQRQNTTTQKIHEALGESYAKAYTALQTYTGDLQQITDAMQGLIAPSAEQAKILQSVPLDKRNAVLYTMAVLRANQRPSLVFRVELMDTKRRIMQALLAIDPQASGVSNEKYHADLEKYGKFLIDFDDCFLTNTEKSTDGLPWISLGAGIVGGYTLKEAVGERGLTDILATFFGVSDSRPKKGEKQKRA